MDKSKYIQEQAAKLRALNLGDTEAAHMQADEILLQTLAALGAGEVAEAFEEADNKVGFWYA